MSVENLFNQMSLYALIIPVEQNNPEPEEKEDEFVKLSEYEKLERELEKANKKAEHYRLKLLGSQNLVCLLQKDNERLLAENEGLQKLMSNMAAKEADKSHSDI